MKSKQVLLVVAVALICGGIAGYASARLANGGAEPTPEPTIVAVEQLQFVDGSGNHRFTLEPGGRHTPGLVLKDSTGRPLCNLPPLLRVLPAER